MAMISGLVNLTTTLKKGPMCQLGVLLVQYSGSMCRVGKDSLVKKGAQRCNVWLFWPGLVVPLPAPPKHPPILSTILTNLPEVFPSTTQLQTKTPPKRRI